MNQICSLSFVIGLVLLHLGCSQQQSVQQANDPRSLTIIAIGDAGDTGPALRGNATYINDMFTGGHDGGKPDAMIFLGDNFYPTGLNIPSDEVRSKINKILGPYRATFEGLGRTNVHAIAGNHDYYARNVIETSILFGLIDIAAGPTGISDKGNQRERNIEWWTYYSKMPADAVYPISAGSGDSVQLLFYDSSLPLRTDPATWRPALDSLRRMLANSAQRPGIVWRVLCQHQPWYSVGDHGGYSGWDDEMMAVTRLSDCDKDSNALGWLINSFDPEDLCAPKYQAQIDSLRSVIHAGGAKIHLVLSGHEHALQLLSYPEHHPGCTLCPAIQIVSGAGAKSETVKLPSPPNEYTASQWAKEGKSLTGFAQLKFELEKVRVVFYNSANGDMIDMGGGKKEFWVRRNGILVP